MQLPHCAAADRNKQAIGDALAELFSSATNVLEIGSGSGQHAVYLCERFPHLQWQVTEQRKHLEGLRALVAQSRCKNIDPALELDVSTHRLNSQRGVANGAAYSFSFSSNTAHIMGIEEVAATFHIVSDCLMSRGLHVLYGPFTESGQHNSDGNSEFDKALRAEDPKMGIRDIAELNDIAGGAGLAFVQQIAMPANNRILVWQKA